MFAFLLAASLFLKLILWADVYGVIRHYYSSRLFSSSFSYLISYLLMIFFMIVLSPFKMLGAEGLLFCYGVTIPSLYLWQRRRFPSSGRRASGRAPAVPAFSWARIANALPLLIVFVLFALLTARSLYYYDTTDDAMIQGLPKVAFIIQHLSLFVSYDTTVINTFSNEWLGEMNSVYYMAMTHKDIATSFANVEIWTVLAMFFAAAYQQFHPQKKTNWPVAVAVSCSAVAIGIAMTIKTDLFAMALLPFAMASLYQYYQNESDWNLFAAIVALGAAAGAKIAILPAAGLLLLILMYHFFFRSHKKRLMPVACGACFFAVACVRYVLNMWYYHNPFQRAINEKASLSLSNLHNSITGILSEFNETPEIWRTRAPWSSSNWSVEKGLGWAGYPFLAILVIAAVWFIIRWLRAKMPISRVKFGYLAMPVLGGFIFTMMATPWYVWSFRYYAPYVFSAVLVSAAWLSARWNEPHIKKPVLWFGRAAAYLILVLSCALNGQYSFRYGQAIPATYEQIQVMAPIEKKLVYSSFAKASDLMAIPKLMDTLQHGGRALVVTNFMAPTYYQYFGDNACVAVDLALDANQLLEETTAKKINYDFFAVNFDPSIGCEAEDALLTQPLESLGYEKYLFKNALIYVKK